MPVEHKTEVILDLTKPMDGSLEIYAEENYRDPDFSCTEWSSIGQQGYRVSALCLGTQTGTHIDAPAHFDSDGDSLDALPVENLIGHYFLIDLPRETNIVQAKSLSEAFRAERILFVRSDHLGVSFITGAALDILLKLPPLVWVVSGQIELIDADPLEFHRLLACHGKYLIENLQAELSRKVSPGGELIALPLRLLGTSGSPCRVVIRGITQ